MEDLIVQLAKDLVTDHKFLSFVFFFISQSLQILFPPYPGDMVLILEGYLSSLADLNIILVISNAVLATFLSSILLYHLGKKEKEKILKSRIVVYLFDVNKVDSLRRLFNRFGALAIILSKFIPGIFSISVLCAGIFEVNKRAAYIGIFLVTSFHHILLIMLGKFVGENWRLIFVWLNTYNRYAFIIVLLGFVIYGASYMVKKRLLNN